MSCIENYQTMTRQIKGEKFSFGTISSLKEVVCCKKEKKMYLNNFLRTEHNIPWNQFYHPNVKPRSFKAFQEKFKTEGNA